MNPATIPHFVRKKAVPKSGRQGKGEDFIVFLLFPISAEE